MIGDPSRIYQYFSSRYGIEKPSPKGWYVFDCPFCGGRKKRAVHVFLEVTKCWTCNYKGSITDFVETTENLDYYEAKQYIYSFESSALDMGMLSDIVGNKPLTSKITLPVGYKSIGEGDTMLGKRARQYLTKRGFDIQSLDEKGFGYCNKHYTGEDGDTSKDIFNKDFFGYIIVPFTRDGRLQYYIGRDFIGNDMRYKNPPSDYVGVGKSEVIYNEAALYLHDEVGIFEGWSDAETLGDHGTAILGWSMSTFQMGKYMKCPAKKLVFFPDAGNDGHESFYRKAVRVATSFIDTDKEVYVVDLNPIASENKKDLNSIGKFAVQSQYNKTKRLTWGTAMQILNTGKN